MLSNDFCLDFRDLIKINRKVQYKNPEQVNQVLDYLNNNCVFVNGQKLEYKSGETVPVDVAAVFTFLEEAQGKNGFLNLDGDTSKLSQKEVTAFVQSLENDGDYSYKSALGSVIHFSTKLNDKFCKKEKAAPIGLTVIQKNFNSKEKLYDYVAKNKQAIKFSNNDGYNYKVVPRKYDEAEGKYVLVGPNDPIENIVVILEAFDPETGTIKNIELHENKGEDQIHLALSNATTWVDGQGDVKFKDIWVKENGCEKLPLASRLETPILPTHMSP